MTIIDVSVNGKIAKASGNSVIVCDNTDYVVDFTFDETWLSEPVKTARFVWNNEFEDVVFSGTQCPIPRIQNAVILGIGVYAGSLVTTTAAYVSVKSSILNDAVPHPEPSPDVYEQILALIEAGAVKGEKGDPGPKGDPGDPGPKGDPGEPGYTPVKGVDYWTDSDKEAIAAEAVEALPKDEAEETSIDDIVQMVIEALPLYEGGNY